MNYCKKSKWEGLKKFFLFGERICGMYDVTVLTQEHQSGRCGCFRPVWLRMAVFCPRNTLKSVFSDFAFTFSQYMVMSWSINYYAVK